MALIEQKFIAAGSYFSATGYVSASLPGTMSDTLGGSQNASLTDLYPNSTCNGFYLNTSSNILTLLINDVSGNVTNSGWDTVTIGSNTFNRADATYSVNSSIDKWEWSGASGAFVNGSSYSVEFRTTPIVASLIEEKSITAGTYFSVTGYVSSTLPGTISDSPGGTENDSLTDLYPNSTCNSFTINSSTNALTLVINDVSNNVTNSGWDTVTVGLNIFNRTDATYSTTSTQDTWVWAGASGSTFLNGRTDVIQFRNVTFLSANIRSTDVSVTQNVSTTDVIMLTLNTSFTPTPETARNVNSLTLNSSTSFNAVIRYKITFQEPGPYTLVLLQSFQSKRYTLTGTVSGPINYNGQYGMLLNDASGNPRMSPLRRQPRVVGSISGTGNGSSFTQSFTDFNTPSPAEWAAVQLQSGSNYYIEQGTTAGQFTIARADVRTSNTSYQTLTPGLETYKILILRE